MLHVIAAYLFKLVHPEDAPGVPAMRPHLLSEAGGDPSVLLRQVLRLHPLIAMEGTDWLLTGSYQIFLLHSCVLSYLTALADHL